MKKLFDLLTSSKGLIIAVGGAIVIYVNLNLEIAKHDIIKQTVEANTKEVNRLHRIDSLETIRLIEAVSLKTGIVVDYSLIRDNTFKAVKEGFADAVAYNEMIIERERAIIDTVIVELIDGTQEIYILNMGADTFSYIQIK